MTTVAIRNLFRCNQQ